MIQGRYIEVGLYIQKLLASINFFFFCGAEEEGVGGRVNFTAGIGVGQLSFEDSSVSSFFVSVT